MKKVVAFVLILGVVLCSFVKPVNAEVSDKSLNELYIEYTTLKSKAVIYCENGDLDICATMATVGLLQPKKVDTEWKLKLLLELKINMLKSGLRNSHR